MGGKFLVVRFDQEWGQRSEIAAGQSVLQSQGWTPKHLLVLDLATGEGAFFLPGGLAAADLDKHQIWVCPLFEPFLCWLYQQDLTDLATLPLVVELAEAPGALQGYRRPGPDRRFPVLYQGDQAGPRNGPLTVPWAWLEKFEGQAFYNHDGQTLEQLAQRGGLSPAEIWMVANGRSWLGSWLAGEAAITPAAALQWLRSEPWKAPAVAKASDEAR